MRGGNGLLEPARHRMAQACGPEHPTCVYEIDAHDCLVNLAGSWSEFAERNGGPHLRAECVLHTSIWKHIAGLENRLLYHEILAYVRARRHKVRFSFRCDGPTTMRELRMDISLAAHHACRFTTVTLRESPQPYLALLDPASDKSDECLSVCNWCMRIQTHTNAWSGLREGLERLGMLGLSRWPRISFTICSDCLGRLATQVPLQI